MAFGCRQLSTTKVLKDLTGPFQDPARWQEWSRSGPSPSSPAAAWLPARGLSPWEQLQQLYRTRRRPAGEEAALPKRLRRAAEALPTGKPGVVRTHLRDAIVLPEMAGSVLGV